MWIFHVRRLSFLGKTPDGIVYDLLSSSYPLGLLEVKYPYSHRDHSPSEACAIPGFCSQLELHLITPKKLCSRETILTSRTDTVGIKKKFT